MCFDRKKNIECEQATHIKEMCFEKKRDISVDRMYCTDYVFTFLPTSHEASLQAYHRRRDAVSVDVRINRLLQVIAICRHG